MLMLATANGINPALSGAAGGAVSGAATAFLVGGMLILLCVAAILKIIVWAGLWKASSKAGHFGLLACIPLVQFFILALMAGKPAWWGLLFLIPIVNFAIAVIVTWEIVKRFDRGVGTMLGLWFLPFVFWPVLGFGSAQYNANV